MSFSRKVYTRKRNRNRSFYNVEFLTNLFREGRGAGTLMLTINRDCSRGRESRLEYNVSPNRTFPFMSELSAGQLSSAIDAIGNLSEKPDLRFVANWIVDALKTFHR